MKLVQFLNVAKSQSWLAFSTFLVNDTALQFYGNFDKNTFLQSEAGWNNFVAAVQIVINI